MIKKAANYLWGRGDAADSIDRGDERRAFVRHHTRDGLATVAHEIAQSNVHKRPTVRTADPPRFRARGLRDVGHDPYYLACEGRPMAVVAADPASEILAIWRDTPAGTAPASSAK